MCDVTHNPLDSMPTVIAITNQKGGVGKTTSTTNLSYALAKRGHSVLAVDLDPQASLTIYSGKDPRVLEQQERTLYYALLGDKDLASLVLEGETYDIIPSSIRMASGESELITSPLVGPDLFRNKLRPIRDQYDYILIDCPPTLTLLAVNALAAADEVLIPVKTDYLSLMGIPYLLDSIKETRRKANQDLSILGVLPTMYNPNYNHDNEALEALKESVSHLRVFEPINKSTGYDKSTSQGKPTLQVLPDTPGARNYYTLADIIINNHE